MTTAELEPLSVAIPLREEPPGVFRVGESRVLLELVIRAFQRGETPEGIALSIVGQIRAWLAGRAYSEAVLTQPA